MKKKLYALFFITLFLFGAFSIRAIKQEDFPLLGKVIYLDAGHPEYSYTQNNEK